MCGDKVCLTVQETVAVARYVRETQEIEAAVQACEKVVRE